MVYQNKYEKERLSLFQKYNTNIKLIKDKYPNSFQQLHEEAYYCPLCLKGFSVNAIYGTNPSLTLEHIVPASVGGKKKVLTCASCNNNHGAKTDSLLHNHLKGRSFLEGILNVEADVKIKFHDDPEGLNKFPENGINASVKHLDESGKKWMFYSKTNAYLDNKLKKFFSTGGSFDVNITFPAEEAIKVGIVKAAYLYAFYKLGYAFIFTKHGQMVRKLLEKKDVILNNLIIYGTFENKNIPDGIYLLEKDSDNDGYLVLLTFNTKKFTVLMPGNSDRNILSGYKKPDKLHFRDITNFDIINNESQFDWPFTYWTN